MTGEALHEIAYPDCVHATATCMFYLLSIRIQLWRINMDASEQEREKEIKERKRAFDCNELHVRWSFDIIIILRIRNQ